MSFFFDPLPRHSFDLVEIDFPWHFDTWSKKGEAKSPQGHYRTMTLAEVAATAADELLAPGGVMVMWATWPMIGQQHLICENAFGLTVKTGGAWSKRTRSGKLRCGPGKLLRSVCEPFLIATRKDHKFRARGRAYNLIETMAEIELEGLAREHSRKPEEMKLLLESLTPGWRRADVFARESRDGWTTWGWEKTKFDVAKSKSTQSNGIRRKAA